MSFKFVEVLPAAQIQTDHLECSLRRRAVCVDKDQQARDDRHVNVNLDAVGLRAERMPAAP